MKEKLITIGVIGILQGLLTLIGGIVACFDYDNDVLIIITTIVKRFSI